MFNIFVGHSTRYSYLYGMLLLLHKSLTIWVLASTVKSTEQPVRADNLYQFLLLGVMQLMQLGFIGWQHPYNERTENIVQGVVAFQQGVFYVIMVLGAAGAGIEKHNEGPVLNIVNMVAMAVLMANAIKAQVFGMRNMMLKAKRTLTQLVSSVEILIADPCAAVCCTSSIHSNRQHRPLTDRLSLESYWRDIPHIAVPRVLHTDMKAAVVDAADCMVQENDSDDDVNAMVESIMQMVKANHAAAVETSGCPEWAGEAYMGNGIARLAVWELCRDSVVQKSLLRQVSEWQQGCCAEVINQLAPPHVPEDTIIEGIHFAVRQLMLAKTRVVLDAINNVLSTAAGEAHAHDWPPENAADANVWFHVICQARAEPGL